MKISNKLITEKIVESETKRNTEQQNILAACLHCNTALRPKQIDFCCLGCEFVYKSINKLGLDIFYKLREPELAQSAEQLNLNKDYRYLLNAELQQKILVRLANNFQEVSFYLPTIHCAACVWLLEKLPTVVKGIQSTRVSFNTSEIKIIFNPEEIDLVTVAKTLQAVGYPPVPATDDAIRKENKAEDRRQLYRIGIAAVCAANTMMLSDSIIATDYSEMEPHFRTLFIWLSAFLTLPVVTYCAWPFYRSALSALTLGVMHIDLPISLAIIVSYVADLYRSYHGSNDVFYDSITCLVFLLLLARFIQRRALSRAQLSTNTSWDLFPAKVLVLEGDQKIERDLQELTLADVVEVKASERFPADGEITKGESAADTSFLTGEALPTEISVGSKVLGGALNLNNSVQMQVTALGAQTRLGKILDTLKRNQHKKSRFEDITNHYSGYFVAVVICLTIMAYLSWLLIDSSKAFGVAIALLVITCPCALGLAVPTVITVALAAAHCRKIYIKNSDALQILAAAENFYFDKTGTLTTGKFSVQSFWGKQESLADISQLARAAQKHPAAAAVLDFCLLKKNQLRENCLATTAIINQEVGRGVSSELNGEKVYLGSYKWLRELGCSFPAELVEKINFWQSLGQTSIFYAEGREVRAAFAMSDCLAPNAQSFINYLKGRDKKIFILSGDQKAVVINIAQQLNINTDQAIGELLPEQKAEILKNDIKLKVMIGDGLNDALALRAADLGIAVQGGIEASLEVADIFIARANLNGVFQVFRAAEVCKQIIVRNLGVSLLYNILGATAALAGYITPLVASIMMPLSSLTVVISSVVAKYFKDEKWK